MPINLTTEQVNLVNQISGLTYNEDENAITGVLAFDLIYECDGQQREQIVDEYHIRIDLNDLSSETGLPKVRETAGRIVAIGKKKGLPFWDMHLNTADGELCIAIGPKAKERYPNGFDLAVLLEHLQEHFYWVSYFEKHNKEPWKAYGHNEKGYWQLFLEDQKKYGPTVKEYFRCITRSDWHRKIKELRKKYR